MAYDQNDNEIVLFPNKRKRKDSDPDATGHGMIDGKEYWANGWLNVSQNGNEYRKVKLRPKDDTDQRRYDDSGDEQDIRF